MHCIFSFQKITKVLAHFSKFSLEMTALSLVLTFGYSKNLQPKFRPPRLVVCKTIVLLVFVSTCFKELLERQ